MQSTFSSRAHGARYAGFLTHDRGSFNHVAAGVSAADLDADLAYVRAKDKADKSLEIYKFFVNSLYVALTRVI